MSDCTILQVSESVRHEISPPRYTRADENTLSARIETFQKAHPDYAIVPITKHPDTIEAGDSQRIFSSSYGLCQRARNEAHAFQADVVRALFTHISSSDTAAVLHLIRQGFISPDCPKANGETPLLASIRCRSAPSARALLALGADPNLTGMSEPGGGSGGSGGGSKGVSGWVERTPLMLAAETGQLAIVKMLVWDFGADDAIIGRHGQTALRLAAKGGHRDVVRYLPARRGGAWRRLKHNKEVVALRKAVVTAKKAVVIIAWGVPRCLVFDIPWAIAKFIWRRRHRILPHLLSFANEVPGLLVNLVKCGWRGIKWLPRLAWRVVLWISEVVPRAGGIIWKGLVEGAKRIGHASAFAVRRLTSVVHSFFAAVITRLKEITLKDVGHDLMVAMEAIFVKLPLVLCSLMLRSVAVAGRAIKTCFSSRWKRKVFKLLCVVPKIFWSVLESLWASFGRGLDELMTLVNPKRVSSVRTRP